MLLLHRPAVVPSNQVDPQWGACCRLRQLGFQLREMLLSAEPHGWRVATACGDFDDELLALLVQQVLERFGLPLPEAGMLEVAFQPISLSSGLCSGSSCIGACLMPLSSATHRVARSPSTD